MVSTPFNIFRNKENVESMLNESLNHFKFGFNTLSTSFQLFFYASNNFEPPVQTPPTSGSTTVLNAC